MSQYHNGEFIHINITIENLFKSSLIKVSIKLSINEEIMKIKFVHTRCPTNACWPLGKKTEV